MKIEVTEQDEIAYQRWLLSKDLTLTEAFALYRVELLAERDEQLKRCFKGDVVGVRNEIIMQAIKQQTDRVLAMPQEDVSEYLSRRYDN